MRPCSSPPRKIMATKVCMLLTSVALAALAGGAMADETWVGGISDDWNDPNNWQVVVPTSSDVVTIGAPASYNTLIGTGDNAQAGSLLVGYAPGYLIPPGWSPSGLAGQLNISGGGTLATAAAGIGHQAGYDGTVVVTGIGSSWTNNVGLNIGGLANGTMVVTNGGAVASAVTYLGYGTGVTGSLTLSAGGSYTNSGAVIVGNNGSGFLTLVGAGTMDSAFVYVGSGASSNGMVSMDGAGTVLNVTSNLFVGQAGTGAMTVEGDADATADNLFVGSASGSNGSLTVDGAGSMLTVTTNAYVGDAGTGALDITNGGGATITGSLFVGNQAGGIGSLSVDSGATLGATSYLSLGVQSGANGSVNVDGAGSVLGFGGDIKVGDAGTGLLSVTNGGTVNEGTGSVLLGSLTGGSGTVQINGSGSTVNVLNGSLDVGYLGDGIAQITNGGAANSNNGFVGHMVNSVGAVVVDGTGSSWTMTNDLIVGHSGAAGLTISNGGVVTNAGVANTVGGAAGSSGTVLITGAGSAWQNTNGGLVIGNDGTGTVTVANGGTLSAATGIALAVNSGSSGVLNIGAAEGAAAAAAGNVTNNIIFGAGAGTLVFNHTETAYTFSPTLETLGTAGEIRQLAGHTVFTGNSALFDGTVNVLGGILSVNGDLGGATVNINGGTLGGSGSINVVAVNSGGNLAPGNSIGTLTVGLLTINAGSTYTVELNDGGFVAGGNNDLIQTAFGTVTINGGMVHVTPENGTDDGTSYTPGTYTIIQAGNGVNGTFDAVSDDYAFLNFALSYDANSVFLTSSVATSFCLSGMSANQCAAGDGVFSLASGGLFGAVLNLSNAEAPGALAQLSGEADASVKTALIEDSRFVREAAVARTRAVFDAVASDRTASERRVSDRLAFWGQGFGSWGQWDGDGNAAQLDRSIGGLFLGGDTRVDNNVRVGALTGYSRSNIAVDDLYSSATVDSYYLGLYGGGQWGAVGLRAGGAYTWNAVDMARAIAFTGFSDQLATSFDAATAQVFGEAGYRIDAGQARFEPFANLAYVNLDTDSFTEGGGAAALSVASDNTDTTFLTLGLRADTTAMLGGSAVRFAGALGWRHAFGDTLPTSLMAFASGGDAFTVAAVPIAEEVLVVDAGVNVTLAPAAMLSLIYGGQFASGESDQSVKGSLDVKF